MKGLVKKIYMHKLETQTTMWLLPEGRRNRGWVEVSKRGEMGTSVIVSTIKVKKMPGTSEFS